MQAFPPAARDLAYQQRFVPLGLLEQNSPYLDADSELADALGKGIERGRMAIEQALKHSPSPKQNGWDLTYHVFDYNLDFFELGRSTTQSGSSMLNLANAISGARAPHAAVSGETTDTKPPMQWCMRTPTETN